MAVGSYFFHGNLIADQNLDHLRSGVLPDLTATFPDLVNLQNLENRIWFQQNGAPPHDGVNIMCRFFCIKNLMEGVLEGVNQ